MNNNIRTIAMDIDEIPKNHLIRKFSNPEEVLKKAKMHFGNDVRIYLSNKQDKKYMVVNPLTKKYVHFGEMGYEDFTKHKDETRRNNYLSRAKSIRGNWRSNKYSPNNLSINILW